MPTTYSDILRIITPINCVDVISTTQDSCVIVCPDDGKSLILVTDTLLDHGIISKTIRGHFIDCYYILIRYSN